MLHTICLYHSLTLLFKTLARNVFGKAPDFSMSIKTPGWDLMDFSSPHSLSTTFLYDDNMIRWASFTLNWESQCSRFSRCGYSKSFYQWLESLESLEWCCRFISVAGMILPLLWLPLKPQIVTLIIFICWQFSSDHFDLAILPGS